MKIIKVLINHYGSIKKCADALNISDAAIHGWRKRGEIPPKRALQIEVSSNGAIKCQDIRPALGPKKT
jgi:DNA-binding transcriptional regulator YdaS (Cro superfamily)